jgi:zinc finger protein 830
MCLACQVQLKAESLWKHHLTSPLHARSLERIRNGGPDSGPARDGKKRKADEEEAGGDSRKRARGANGLPDGFFDKDLQEEEEKKTAEGPRADAEDAAEPVPPAAPVRDDIREQPEKPGKAAAPVVDEEEWAAFESDIAAIPVEPSNPSAIVAAATITAAPMTAEEIAARSREEASTQAKERLEAETEGEKEDAARRMEEEFDDMEHLEERVKKLKEKREALRLKRGAGVDAGESEIEEPPREAAAAPDNGDGVDDEDEDEADDWDGWGLR